MLTVLTHLNSFVLYKLPVQQQVCRTIQTCCCTGSLLEGLKLQKNYLAILTLHQTMLKVLTSPHSFVLDKLQVQQEVSMNTLAEFNLFIIRLYTLY